MVSIGVASTLVGSARSSGTFSGPRLCGFDGFSAKMGPFDNNIGMLYHEYEAIGMYPVHTGLSLFGAVIRAQG